jgi:hypothetical protein
MSTQDYIDKKRHKDKWLHVKTKTTTRKTTKYKKKGPKLNPKICPVPPKYPTLFRSDWY